MQVKAINANPKFSPVQVVITLETPEEFQSLYQVANYGNQVADLIEKNTSTPKTSTYKLLGSIWRTLHEVYPNGVIK